MDQISRIGMDTSKHIFQLHGVNAAEAPVLRKKMRRKEMVAFFKKLASAQHGCSSVAPRPPPCKDFCSVLIRSLASICPACRCART